MWGMGIYFAENASYCLNNCYDENGNKVLLLVRVILGECECLPPDQTLKSPPKKYCN
jgi:hypothetical protein